MNANRTAPSGFRLAALGMIYGDIATSPLYVLKYIVNESGGAGAISESLVLGSVSLILWTLLLLATAKGVLLMLREDNHGEGGLFALYALVRDRGRWLVVPAALGGAALLADCVLTPALTITAAVEGSASLPGAGALSPRILVLLVLVLLTALFLFQSLGSRRTGRFLGPVMLVWLLFLAIFGALQIVSSPGIFRALDPRWGARLLFRAGGGPGFSLLGLVFLSVTGTEILYANLDYGGRRAITRAWPFVLLCLCLSYLGQGAWLLAKGSAFDRAVDPFYGMLSPALRAPALILALAAAWGASQTLINGSFTLVSEAIRLDLLPALEIRYPSDSIRHEYIPAVNFWMWLLSCAALIVFRSGQRMASVYGLSIAIAMLTSTVMLFVRCRGKGERGVGCLVILFGVLELLFLAASMGKLRTGGAAVLLLTLLLTGAMLSWHRSGAIERRFTARLPLRNHLEQLRELRSDPAYGKLADHLVYFDADADPDTVDKAILYSILDRGPKRANAYWFVSVVVLSEPYARRYQVETFETEYVFRLRLELGYKCSRPLTWYLRDVFRDMERRGLIRIRRKSYCLSEDSALGTFQYCVLRRRVSGAEALSLTELWAMRQRKFLQSLAGVREEWYTDEDTNLEVEWIPLSLAGEDPVVRLQRLLNDREDPPAETE